MKQYCITGHSSETTETFTLPKNVTLVFYAEEEYSCYVPHDEESLDLVIKEMNDSDKFPHITGVVPNYYITMNNPGEGIAVVTQSNGFNFLNVDKSKTLSDCIKLIQRQTGPAKVIIYCVFCRGSKQDRQFDQMTKQTHGVDLTANELLNILERDYQFEKAKSQSRLRKKTKSLTRSKSKGKRKSKRRLTI